MELYLVRVQDLPVVHVVNVVGQTLALHRNHAFPRWQPSPSHEGCRPTTTTATTAARRRWKDKTSRARRRWKDKKSSWAPTSRHGSSGLLQTYRIWFCRRNQSLSVEGEFRSRSYVLVGPVCSTRGKEGDTAVEVISPKVVLRSGDAFAFYVGTGSYVS